MANCQSSGLKSLISHEERLSESLLSWSAMEPSSTRLDLNKVPNS